MRCFYDPCISRIKEIFRKICPKFLDLYASIYGTLIYNVELVPNIMKKVIITELMSMLFANGVKRQQK